MPTKRTIDRAHKAERQGKAPSTQAGEFVKEEIDDIRSGKHGARSTKQAIAIGLSKARRAGVKLPPPRKGKTSERTRLRAEREYESAQKGTTRKPSPTRARASKKALEREGQAAASHEALSEQARAVASRRRAASSSSTTRTSAGTKRPRSSTKSQARTTRARPRIG